MFSYYAGLFGYSPRVLPPRSVSHANEALFSSLCSTALLGAGIADTRKMDGIQVLERGRLCMSSNRGLSLDSLEHFLIVSARVRNLGWPFSGFSSSVMHSIFQPLINVSPIRLLDNDDDFPPLRTSGRARAFHQTFRSNIRG